jgi:hypothetical protein
MALNNENVYLSFEGVPSNSRSVEFLVTKATYVINISEEK